MSALSAASTYAYLGYAGGLRPITSTRQARPKRKEILRRTLRTNDNGQQALNVFLSRFPTEPSVRIVIFRADTYLTATGFQTSYLSARTSFSPSILRTHSTEKKTGSWFSRAWSNLVGHRGTACTQPSLSISNEEASSPSRSKTDGDEDSCWNPPTMEQVSTVVIKAFVEVTWTTQGDDLEQSEALTRLDNALTDIYHLLKPDKVKQYLRTSRGQDAELRVRGRISSDEQSERAPYMKVAKMEMLSALDAYLTEWSIGEHGLKWLDPRTKFSTTPGPLPTRMMPQPPPEFPVLEYNSYPQTDEYSDEEDDPLI